MQNRATKPTDDRRRRIPLARAARRVALACAGLAAGLGVVAAAYSWLNRSTIDPRAMALLNANEARLQTVQAVTGETCISGENCSGVTTFRLRRPFYADVHASLVETDSKTASRKSQASLQELHWSDKSLWRIHTRTKDGERVYMPRTRDWLQYRFHALDDDTLFGDIFAKTLFKGKSKYARLVNPAPEEREQVTVRYEGKRSWHGALYDAVFMSQITHDPRPAWDDVRSGSCTLGEWAPGRIGPAPLGGVYKTNLLIGADHLVHQQKQEFTSYYHGQPHWGTGLVTIELRNVRINPPLTPADFRYAPPAGAYKPPKPRPLPPGFSSSPPLSSPSAPPTFLGIPIP